MTPVASNGNGPVFRQGMLTGVTDKDLIFQERAHEHYHNAMLTRRNFEREMLDKRRSINDECGYPDRGELGITQFKQLYEREGIATKVVEIMPKKSWTVQPTLTEDEDPEVETEFELAWEQLGKDLASANTMPSKSNTSKVGNIANIAIAQLKIEKDEEEDTDENNEDRSGWLKTENKGHPMWEYLLRVDILSGIGHYGVVFLGFDDVTEKDGLEKEVKKGEERKLLFVRVFDEELAQITAFETDPTSPRFGQPTIYSITFNDPRDTTEGLAAIGVSTTTKNVHWTRIIHIADNLGSNEIFGVPRQRPNYNRLHDLKKLYGGSAEMYWKGAFMGLSIESHPQLGPNVKFPDDMNEQMDLYQQGLQRYLTFEGATANALAPQVVDPSAQIDVQLTAICIQIGCPKRIFMGSERGELASSEDHDEFDEVIQERQENYLTPRVIAPTIDRLISVGVLPEPVEGYSVVWPDKSELSDLDSATVAKTRTEALGLYLEKSVDQLIPPMEYLTKELGYTEEEAEAALDKAMEAIEAEETMGQLMAPDEPEEDPFTDPMDMLKQKQAGDVDIEKIRQSGRNKVTNEELQDVINEFNLTPEEGARVLVEMGEDDE